MGSPRHLLRVAALAALAVLAGAALVVSTPAAHAQSARQAETPTTAVNDGPSSGGNILPRPDSGTAPDSPNDPGGWQQLLVFALIVAGLGAIVAMVLREARRARGTGRTTTR